MDDNESFLELFRTLPGADGYDIATFTAARDLLAHLETETADVVVSDVMMPGVSGNELFRTLQDRHPEIPVILVTAFGSTEDAVAAVKSGAYHYFEKPLSDKVELLWTTVRNAVAARRLAEEITALHRDRELHAVETVPLLGRSEGMQRVFRAVLEVADLPVTVLITGETGTGKELVARAIHKESARKERPFFAISCVELAPGLLESELFGHEKGSFTGAVERKKGLFEIAHRGTLFLDEISEAPVSLQAKLLRVLESREFKRVGGTAMVTSDFRIVAATNRDLEAAVGDGRFRKDLFYRLNVYTIDIPPLRRRREDIPPIAAYYLERYAREYRRPAERFSEQALVTLRDYDWPGNVRELTNVVERAVITCREPVVTSAHLPFGDDDERTELSTLNLKEMERLYVELALERTENNKTRAAELLGISRKTLIEKVKLYGMDNQAPS